MRISQLTQAFNPLMVLLVLLTLAIPAIPVHPLSSDFIANRHPFYKRLSRLDDTGEGDGDACGGRSGGDTIGDGGIGNGGACDEGGDFNSCKDDPSNPNSNSNNGILQNNNPMQTATNIAQKAAQEAEQAYGTQQCAAAEVARQVKKQLADRAFAAAKAAEAALSGKQQMVNQLEDELCAAEAAMQEQSACITNSQNSLRTACLTAKQAQQLVIALQNILKMAENHLIAAKNVANGLQQELSEKSQSVEKAQSRIDTLKRMLKATLKELENIKISAYKAACAAAEARQKANRDRRMASQKQRTKRAVILK